MQLAEFEQFETIQATCPRRQAFRTTLPGDLLAALSPYLITSGHSLECLLIGAWCHLMSCYSTAEAVAVSIVREDVASSDILKELRFVVPGNSKVRNFLADVAAAVNNGGEVDAPVQEQDMSLVLPVSGSTPEGFAIAFNSSRFGLETGEMLAACLMSILRELPQYDDRDLTELPFISREILTKYSGLPHDVSRIDSAVCVHHQIEMQSSTNPEKICVVSDYGQLDFGTLNKQANQLARYLRSRDIGPETIVAVHLDRSIELLVALLAILKAGAAFVPLDATLAEGRVQNVIEDSKASLILTWSRLESRFKQWRERVICVDVDKPRWQGELDTDFPSLARPENLAYVTYTSGSTGKPKGVMVEHRNLAAFSNSAEQFLGSIPGVYLATTNISFDVAVVELLWSLSRGFKLILHVGDEGLPVVSGPRSIAAQMIQHGVTHVQGTPSLMRLIMTDASATEALKRVQKLFIGGEPFPPALVSTLLPVVPGDVINAYGPTETTVASTFHFVRRSSAVVPIGKPLSNTLCYVLDKHGRLLPPLAPGELFIGGAGVARGYLYRPDLTSERFQRDTFDNAAGGRTYRTGDLVRMRLDGELEFIERVDLQVKIRGYRIELGEIETVIEKFPNVASATVVVRQEPSGEKTLVGYYSEAGSELVQPVALREYLRNLLPSYMVPPVLQRLDSFPLTSNGKVDRAKLAQFPSREQQLPDDKGQERVSAALDAPADDSALQAIEDILCSWCAALLKLPAVEPLDDFFQIGGESVIAAQLAQQIAANLGKNLRLSEFVKARNMRALARVVCQTEGQHRPWSPVITLRKGSKVPLFLISGLGGNAVNFELLAPFLPERSIYGVETHGVDRNGQALTTVEEMAASYLRAIREVEPEGPYHLVGYSFGGTLAFEMAQQLRASGQVVGVLALLDTPEWHHTQEAMASLVLSKRLHLLYGATLKQLVFGPNRRETLRKRIKATFEHHRLSVYARLGRKASSADASTEHRNFHALTSYVPQPYEGEIHLFRCRDQSTPRTNPTLGWDRLCNDIAVSDLPGEHDRIFSDPVALNVLGSQLCGLLNEGDLELLSHSEAPAGERHERSGKTGRILPLESPRHSDEHVYRQFASTLQPKFMNRETRA